MKHRLAWLAIKRTLLHAVAATMLVAGTGCSDSDSLDDPTGQAREDFAVTDDGGGAGDATADVHDSGHDAADAHPDAADAGPDAEDAGPDARDAEPDVSDASEEGDGPCEDSPTFTVKEVSFSGGNTVNVKATDPNNWSSDKYNDTGSAIGTPQWSDGGHRWPISYIKSGKPSVKILLGVAGNTCDHKIDVDGDRSATSIHWHAGGIAVPKGTTTVTVDLGAPTAGTVETTIKNTSMSIAWKVAVDGGASNSIGTTTNKMFVTFAAPTDTATAKRLDWTTSKASGRGAGQEVDATRDIHKALSGLFTLNANCASTPWTILDGTPTPRADCISLVSLHQSAQKVLGLDGGTIEYAYASSDNDVSSLETRNCPTGVHYNPEKLRVKDSSGGINNWEAILRVYNISWPGGFAEDYTSNLLVLCDWLSSGATQVWRGINKTTGVMESHGTVAAPPGCP